MAHTARWSRLFVCWLACTLAILLVACGSDSAPKSTTNEQQPDFALSLSSSTMALTAGSTGQSVTITADAKSGFGETVSVKLSGLPGGVTANPSTLNLAPGVSQNVTLTADPSAAAGSATITMTGTSGMLVHTATLMLTISTPPPAADFTLSASPTNLALTAGATGEQLSVSVAALNGFSDNVNVTFSGLPTGVTATPSTLTLTPGTPQSVTLTAAANAALGMVNLTVTGNSGSLSHTTDVSLNVSAAPPVPSFTMSVTPINLSLTVGATGKPVVVTISAINGFTGRVDVALTGLPAGVSASPASLSVDPASPQTVTFSAAKGATVGDTTIVFTGTSGTLGSVVNLALKVSAPPPPADFTFTAVPSNLTLTAGAAGKNITLTATGGDGFNSPVAVSVSGLGSGVTATPATLSLTPGTAQDVNLTAAANATIGSMTATFTGTSGSLTHTATVAIEVASSSPSPDFALSVVPQSLTITVGEAGQQVALSAAAKNGFNNNVNVAVSGLPSGVTTDPSTLTLTPGTPQNSTITAAANAATGNATITFTGTSSSLSHTAALALTVNAPPPPPGVDMTTYHYDNARTGLNANETTLTHSNVNSTSFGKIDFFPVDGKVDAQPLYLSGLSIKGGTHNVLYVASEQDSVYAFDADTGSILWQTSVLGADEVPSDSHNCKGVTPTIGITATPVIDRALGAIFVVAMSKDKNGKYYQRLHALNLATGAEMKNPAEIAGSFKGNGYGSVNGMHTFDPAQYMERVALLLMKGSIFMAWSSHCDHDPYTGWVMMYNENTLNQTGVFNLTPNGLATPHYNNAEGSIWMSGAGLAGDADGNMYFLDANGTFDTTLDTKGFPSQGNFGNSFMKFSSANNVLTPVDYFAPYNTVHLSIFDQDLGSGGVLLLPDVTDANGTTRHLALGAGKDGNIYVVDRDNMGKFNPSSNSNLYQQVSHVLSPVFAKPSYFNGSIYYGSINSALQAFPLQSGKLGAVSSASTVIFGYPGTTPVISANGTQNGIAWAVQNTSPAVLYAFDASNLATELYNSNQAANARDQFGDGNKFITPTVVNGKVFVGTPTGVAVFGLLH